MVIIMPKHMFLQKICAYNMYKERDFCSVCVCVYIDIHIQNEMK